MKKSVKIVIIIAIILMIAIPVGVLASQQVKMTLYLPENEHKQTLTYRETASTFSEEQTNEAISGEEIEINKEIDESNKNVAKAVEILKKYNGTEFEKAYNKSHEEKKGKLMLHDDQYSDAEKKVYEILIRTCENENITKEERQILNRELEGSARHIEKIPELKERMNHIINE